MSIKFGDFMKQAGTLLKGRAPGQVIIQMTDFCNATCPQCGMRVQEKFQRHKLEEERVVKMIERAAANNVSALSFTGGEPFMHLDSLIRYINHASQLGIKFIRTGTNAYFLMGHEKPDFEDKVKRMAEKLAATNLYTIWFSIDSWSPELHETNRGLPGVIKGMEKAMPVFKEFGIHPSANLGINRLIETEPIPEGNTGEEFYNSYKEGFRKFYRFVDSLGFTIVNACYPMSADGESVYQAESSDRMVSYTTAEKIQLFSALYDTLPEFRPKMRIFTPRTSLLSLLRQFSGDEAADYGCRGGIDFYYIDGKDGHAHPCGFREGEDMGRYEDFESKGYGRKAHCRKCDWECFRDPSTLLGPLVEFFEHPAGLVSRMANDRQFFKLWLEDVSYYAACGFFNCRQEPDYKKMAKHAEKQSEKKLLIPAQVSD
jgi:sulfatase maturation enzyme AslB (radical SAM superfamily)